MSGSGPFPHLGFRQSPSRVADDGTASRLVLLRKSRSLRDLFAGTGFLRVWVCHDVGHDWLKTPTLAIVCKRELEIRNFVPIAYFEVVATAEVAGGQFQMRHAPQDRIVKREIAQDVVKAAEGFEGALAVRVEDKRQGPPKLHDLPSLQKLCGSRFGWSASKTLEVAQELYDGQGKKIVTYPRAEVRYLPKNLISDVPRIIAGLRVGQSFGAIPVPEPPMIRRGASGTFYDKGLEGASHHAVIPNVNTIDKLPEVWPRLSSDERKLFDIIARAYLAALMPDFRYRQTTATLDVRGFEFRAAGRQPVDLGWRAAFPEWQPADEKGDEAQLLPPLRNGDPAFQHEGANLIDDTGALRDQPLAHPMQCLQIKLLRGLGRHELHRRALHGFGNRFGIIEVVLLSLAIGANIFGRINLAS
jgi:DNA topoisomerase IA